MMSPLTMKTTVAPAHPVEADLVITGAGELLTCPAEGKGIGLVVGGAVAAKDGRVVWVGPAKQLRSRVTLAEGAVIVDAGGPRGDARACRLSHPSHLCRRPIGGVSSANRWSQLSGSGAGRWRHREHREGDQGRER